jgi:heme oxygenase (biliverdin-producing, ferredoxin)
MTRRTFRGAHNDGDTAASESAAPASDLSNALRERTQALHTRAERSGIINDVLCGKVSRYGYALLLRNLLPAYRHMEAGLEQHRQTPGVRAFARREVYRAQALEADLQALYGIEWAGSLALLPAGEQYGLRVTAAAQGDGAQLIGHAYARYLGDLSGGQILRRLLARAPGLRSHELSFYDFPDIGDAGVFKRSYRNALDQVAAEIADTESVLLGAMAAFELNIAVSEAVQLAALEQS